jgi:N-acetyl-anhydromuramyl-L-alanine amidase AmpD
MTTPFRLPAFWQSRPSPNHSPRSAKVTAIVLHADASNRIESSLDWCRRVESKVSYHVIIGRNGLVFSLVHPDRKAWHAGISTYLGRDNCNEYTIGVCLSNRNDGEPFPVPQVASAAEVCAVLCKHYKVKVDDITTHAIVATPAGRKTDPHGFDIEAFRVMVTERLAPPAPRAA